MHKAYRRGMVWTNSQNGTLYDISIYTMSTYIICRLKIVLRDEKKKKINLFFLLL